MKKLWSLLALTMISCGLCACQKAPLIEDYKDEMSALIEASYEINDIFFGEGLPTYERGGAFDLEHHVYSDDDSEFAAYEYVTQESGYLFTDRIKWAAGKVYTADYLEGVYTMAFDGYADNTTGAVSTARYLDGNSWLLKYSYGDEDPFDILPGDRRYNLDTMKIVKPYSKKYINVSVESYLLGSNEILEITLRFKKTDDGLRLDTPTY